MTDAALWHRLYTHGVSDARSETTGGRFVELDRDASKILPREAQADLDDLLRKVTPSASGVGYVARRYGAGDQTFACVVVSYADLVSDAGGRRGLVNHARLVRMPNSELAFDLEALVSATEHFPIEDIARAPASERLQAYLDQLALETSVPLRALALRPLQEIPRTFLCALLTAGLTGIGRKEGTRFLLPRPDDDSLALTIARGWAALPVALQRRASWAVDIEEGCPVDAIFSTSTGRAPAKNGSSALADSVTRYVNLLLDGPGHFSAILGNAEIVSVERLDEAVQRAAKATTAAASTERRTEMKKGKANEPPQPSGGEPLDSEIVAQMDRQFRAMEQSLRSYIDQRIEAMAAIDPQRSRGAAPLAAIDQTVQDQPRPQYTRTPAPPRANRKALLIGGVVAALLIALGVWYYFREPAGDPRRATGATKQRGARAQQPTGEQSDDRQREQPAANRDTIRAAIAAAEGDGKFAESLKALIVDHGPLAAAYMYSAANGDDLDGDVVTTDARDALSDLATRVQAKDELTSADRDRLRAYLIEYIAALAARDVSGASVSVDGELRDVSPDLVKRLKDTHRVKTRSNDPKDMQLQSEIILRWMEAAPR